ncbi:MFS superfamily sulfate permease-like transporter [Actinomycetospora cinnamomea]|uniref:MFS superfamily sulfate permease-like transporter n=1 Tax=Actinomycetospora cinnamomea TaxID=663609 RepID=A0A2U1F9N1_9PSEU|nr:MFS superfamily sulfate permease-like transporter [Actinomycetospora cinnamomea]
MTTGAITVPAERDAPSWGERLRADVPASLVVFLVAVPLSLGIAVASDAPLTAGLIAAAVGGLVAGALGGSPLQVSGPAAGLTVVVADLVGRFGWGVTCAITVAAGVLQVIFGLTRTGRAALAISPAVVHGMLAGIGVTIVLGQLHIVLGGEQQDDAVAGVLALPAQLLGLHGPATVLGLAVIAILLLWARLPRRVPAWVRGIPAPLPAVVATTGVAGVAALPVERVEIGGSVLDAITPPVLPAGQWSAFAVGVLTVAIIASVESLLSAVAVDRMPAADPSRPRSDLDRELVGQGAGNTVSGLLGGLPITGVIVRSSTNVATGARTRASAILHGVWIVVFSVALLGLVEQIPMAVLAGLLVVIGARLVKLAHMRELHRHGELPVYLVTIAGVVLTDLLTGVLTGLGLAVLLVLRRVVWASIEVQEPAHGDDRLGGERPWHVVVEGALCFPSVPRLARRLGQVPAGAPVVIDLVTDYLDHAAYDHLSEWIERHEREGGRVRVDEVGTMGLLDRRAASNGGPGDRRPGPVPRSSVPGRCGRRDTGTSSRSPPTTPSSRACASTTAVPPAWSRRTSPTSPTGRRRTRSSSPARTRGSCPTCSPRAVPATCSPSATSATSRRWTATTRSARRWSTRCPRSRCRRWWCAATRGVAR